ncbi:MAG: DUF2079 domain-containing protein, partial [Labilithrix sp.]|nr:DUF2079 domain-containing protein [Labilithrix sp.]
LQARRPGGVSVRGARVFASLVLGAWALGSFAFAVAHATWSYRAVIFNALGDDEQRTLRATMAVAFVAVGALAAERALQARSRGEDPIAALDDLSRAALFLVPLGLWGVYHAQVFEHVILCLVVLMSAGWAFALYKYRWRPALRPHVAAWVTRLAPFVVVALSMAHALMLYEVTRRRGDAFANGWDLAVYDQSHWNILDSGMPWSTMYSATGTENHFSIHFSPIYYLTALIYALRPEAQTIIAIQNVAVALGALPLFLLTRHKTGSSAIAACFACSYLANPLVHSIVVYDFHDIGLFVPLALGVLWAFETDRHRAFWLFAILALMVREDTPLYLGIFALYAWSTGKRSQGTRLGVMSLAYFVLVHAVFMPALRLRHVVLSFHGRLLDLQRPPNEGLGTILETLVTNPTFCVTYLFRTWERPFFLAIAFVPLALLPLRSGRAILLMTPGLFFCVMSSFPAQYAIWTHYSGTFLAFVYYAAVIGLVSFASRYRGSLALAVLACSLLLSGKYGRYSWLNPGFVRMQLERSESRYGFEGNRRLMELALSVPKSDTVRATNNILPVLSNRRWAFILPGGVGTDWVFIDYRRSGDHSPATFEDARRICREVLASTEYGVVYIDDSVVVARKWADPASNAEALARIERADIAVAP